MKCIKAIPTQSVDQLEFLRVSMAKAGIQVNDRTENGYRDACNNDGTRTGSKPYDE